MPNYSQCPGECYDSFWDEENNTPPINIDKLFDKHHTRLSNVQIEYHRKDDNSKCWLRCDTMKDAIKISGELLKTGDYIITSIIDNNSKGEF
jgi:hypothetical protein